MTRQKYPVWVDETVRRLVWVEADMPGDAPPTELEPKDYRNVEPCDAWVDVTAPKSGWDYEYLIYGTDGAAPLMNAHVLAHQYGLTWETP